MPTPADTTPASVRSPAGVGPCRTDGVADDLQAIFPNAPPRASATRLRLDLGREARPSPRIHKRVAAIGAMVAAALGGLSAGALISRGPTPAPPSSALDRTEQVRIVVTPHPDAKKGATSPLRAPRPEPAALIGLPSPGPLAPPQVVRTFVEASPPTPVARAKAQRPKPPAARKVARRDATVVPAREGHCRGACDYEDVLNADARLRRAYASAADAGVARPVLVGYRDEWASLRQRAPRQPGQVVTRYGEMARDLERYADSPRMAHAPSRRNHTLDGFRTDLASLFR